MKCSCGAAPRREEDCEAQPRRYTDFGPGLRKAVYNYMHGAGLDLDVSEWFDFKVPRARVVDPGNAGTVGR